MTPVDRTSPTMGPTRREPAARPAAASKKRTASTVRQALRLAAWLSSLGADDDQNRVSPRRDVGDRMAPRSTTGPACVGRAAARSRRAVLGAGALLGFAAG